MEVRSLELISHSSTDLLISTSDLMDRCESEELLTDLEDPVSLQEDDPIRNDVTIENQHHTASDNGPRNDLSAGINDSGSENTVTTNHGNEFTFTLVDDECPGENSDLLNLSDNTNSSVKSSNKIERTLNSDIKTVISEHDVNTVHNVQHVQPIQPGDENTNERMLGDGLDFEELLLQNQLEELQVIWDNSLVLKIYMKTTLRGGGEVNPHFVT